MQQQLKKTLIISSSHTGQTEMAADLFANGLRRHIACDVAHIISEEKFPFPWKMSAFFQLFPRCVRGLAPTVKPLQVNWAEYDLVVLAYQVWFLSPSLPLQGFIQSNDAKNLRDKKILTLVTCRNIWHSAFLRVSNSLKQLGAQHLGQITLCETGPTWASFVTTPRWLLTGKKGAFLFFPEAGLSPDVFAPLEKRGEDVARCWLDSGGKRIRPELLGANVNRVSLAQMEYLGYPFFKFWAWLIARIAKRPNLWQDLLLLLFRVNLVLLILVLVVGTKIFELLVNNNPKYLRVAAPTAKDRE